MDSDYIPFHDSDDAQAALLATRQAHQRSWDTSGTGAAWEFGMLGGGREEGLLPPVSPPRPATTTTLPHQHSPASARSDADSTGGGGEVGFGDGVVWARIEGWVDFVIGHGPQPGWGGLDESLLSNSSFVLDGNVHKDKAPPQRSWSSASSLLVTLISNMGILVFLVALALFSGFATYTLGLLIRALEAVQLRFATAKRADYPILAREMLGPVGQHTANLCIVINQLGVCVFIIILLADLLTPVFGTFGSSHVLCKRYIWQILVVVVVIFPLVLMRTLHSLRHLTYAACAITAVVMLTVFGYSVYVMHNTDVRLQFSTTNTNHTHVDHCTSSYRTIPPSGSKIRAFPESWRTLEAIGIFSFSFACHMNVFPVYNELVEPTFASMRKLHISSISAATVTYLFFGVFGYLTFLESTQPDLFTNFAVSGSGFATFIDILRVGFAAVLVTGFPMVAWEVREGIDHFVFGQRAFTWQRHVALNVVVVGVALVIGTSIRNVKYLVSFLGATSAPVLAFVLPTLVFLKIPTLEEGQVDVPLFGTVNMSTVHHKIALALLYTGMFVLAPASLAAFILQVVNV